MAHASCVDNPRSAQLIHFHHTMEPLSTYCSSAGPAGALLCIVNNKCACALQYGRRRGSATFSCAKICKRCCSTDCRAELPTHTSASIVMAGGQDDVDSSTCTILYKCMMAIRMTAYSKCCCQKSVQKANRVQVGSNKDMLAQYQLAVAV